VKAFSELRAMADDGQIQYPYSTREVVNIVRHLQEFPNDGLGTVVRNVFDFDGYSKEVRDTLTEVLHKHGIPIGTDRRNVQLAKEIQLPPREVLGTWEVARAGGKRHLLQLPMEEIPVKIGSSNQVNVSTGVLDRVEARGLGFSELQSYWSLPFHDFSVVGDATSARDQHGRPLYDQLHVVTSNPVALYSMQPMADSFTSLTLHQFFDTRRQNIIPRPKIAALGGKYSGLLAVYDEVTGNLVLVDPAGGTVLPVPLSAVTAGGAVTDLRNRLTGRAPDRPESLRLLPDFAQDNKLLFFAPGGRTVQMLEVDEATITKLELPFALASLHPLSPSQYLAVRQAEGEEQGPAMFVLKKASEADALPSVLHPLTATTSEAAVTALDRRGLTDFGLAAALGEATSAPNTLLTAPSTYAALALGFPELEFSASEVVGWPRLQLPTVGGAATPSYAPVYQRYTEPGRDVVFLRDSCQVVRPVATKDVPREGVADHVATGNCAAFLEVVDLMAGVVRYIPVPEAPQQSPYASWYKQTYPDRVLGLAAMSNDSLASVDNSGTVRLWETGVANLGRSLAEWKRMIGGEGDLSMTVERESGLDVTDPKHGKIDENNDPHVGGNQWAGGTGGRDTAGLGGKGGPYRLDAGHQVHQVPDHEKEQVPEHVRKAAREMNRRAFAEKLREIQMSEYDSQMYQQYSAGVSRQVQSLRAILDSLQAKSADRTWLKNQVMGELDDNRLIDGLTGERSIYKKRGEEEPEVGSPQEKPKRLKLVVDVSGSMYRFNGHDQRLERMLESCLMLMEALEGYGERIKYDVVGHSGEDNDLPFVQLSQPPANDKERLKVLKEMHAHSQFCMSGDHTMSATGLAIAEAGLAADQFDDSFVIVLSDANFDRYGIRPESIGKVLNRNESVNAYMVFLGSLGNQAEDMSRRLPSGKSFVCLDTKRLPEILQTIFTAAMLK